MQRFIEKICPVQVELEMEEVRKEDENLPSEIDKNEDKNLSRNSVANLVLDLSDQRDDDERRSCKERNSDCLLQR